MNKTRSVRSIILTIVGLAVVIVCFAFVTSADAQVRRTRRPKTAPVASPTPVPGEAEIVRTADEEDTARYLSPSTPVQQETEATLDPSAQKVRDLASRIKKLESIKADPYEESQKRLLLNLDILTRAEQRTESLRKQLFEMIEKENTVKSRLDQIEFDIRPEMISRSATYAGTMRPEEIRDMRKRSLDAEKANLQTLLSEIQTTRISLTSNLQRSEALVEKLRAKLETDIDNSFKDPDPQ